MSGTVVVFVDVVIFHVIKKKKKKFAKIHCFKRTLKDVLPHDTPSHNFLINRNTLSNNFNQKRTPCRRIVTVKGHPVERYISLSQVWEYPPPRGFLGAQNKTRIADICNANLNPFSGSNQTIFFSIPVTEHQSSPWFPTFLLEMK